MTDNKLTVSCLLCQLDPTSQTQPYIYTTTAISRTKRRNDCVQAMLTHVQDAHTNDFSQLQSFLVELTTICSEILFLTNCVDCGKESKDNRNGEEILEYMDDRIERLIDILGLDEDEDEEDGNDNENEDRESIETKDSETTLIPTSTSGID